MDELASLDEEETTNILSECGLTFNLRHYVVIALLSSVSSARMRPWLIFVIPCGSRSVFSKPSLRHSLSLLAWCTLYAPTKDRRPWTVVGGSTEDNAANLWGLACRVPLDHTQPNTVAFLGQMSVLGAERRRLLRWSKERTRRVSCDRHR